MGMVVNKASCYTINVTKNNYTDNGNYKEYTCKSISRTCFNAGKRNNVSSSRSCNKTIVM